MAVRVRQDEALHSGGATGQRLCEDRRRDRLERRIAVLQPPSVEQREARRPEYLRGAVQEALGHGVDGVAGVLLAVLKVPLELADRRAMEGRLQLLLADDGLIGSIDAVQGLWKHEPKGPGCDHAQERTSGRAVLLYLATVPWTDEFRTFLQGHATLTEPERAENSPGLAGDGSSRPVGASPGTFPIGIDPRYAFFSDPFVSQARSGLATTASRSMRRSTARRAGTGRRLRLSGSPMAR